ncbi:hypothetical protein ANN_19065 [Periplaneta americana]|uniref:Uncharacterized protein n=1 Tax=Periplaneta americana TaxID=6978 RepID=A0ABQ8SS00_PERAM|nr:hypothetical protein ANN_19065 [Periplaneta americana]
MRIGVHLKIDCRASYCQQMTLLYLTDRTVLRLSCWCVGAFMDNAKITLKQTVKAKVDSVFSLEGRSGCFTYSHEISSRMCGSNTKSQNRVSDFKDSRDSAAKDLGIQQLKW